MSNCSKILLVLFIASPSSHKFERYATSLDEGSRSKVNTKADNEGGIGVYLHEITE